MKAARLELDYLAPPRRAVWPGVLVLVISLGLGAHLGVRYHEAKQAQQTEESRGLEAGRQERRRQDDDRRARCRASG